MPRIYGALSLEFEHSDKFLQALGRLVAESAMLESQLDWGIWMLLGNDQRAAQIVTAELDFRKKVDLHLALVRHRVQDEKKRLALLDLVTGFHQLYNQRNDFMHARWAPSATNLNRGIIKESAKGTYKFNVRDIDVDTIEHLATRFNESAALLMGAQIDLVRT